MTPPNALDALRTKLGAALYLRDAGNRADDEKILDAILPIVAQRALASEVAAYELFQVAKNFVAWADDCWGSWAINDEETPKAKAEYLAAKEAITKFESLASPSGQPAPALHQCPYCERGEHRTLAGDKYVHLLNGDTEVTCTGKISDSIVHLPCGHGKWDTRHDCITCLQYTVEQLNQTLVNERIEHTTKDTAALAALKAEVRREEAQWWADEQVEKDGELSATGAIRLAEIDAAAPPAVTRDKE